MSGMKAWQGTCCDLSQLIPSRAAPVAAQQHAAPFCRVDHKVSVWPEASGGKNGADHTSQNSRFKLSIDLRQTLLHHLRLTF